MAVNKTAVQYVYGLGDALIQVAPLPILASRAPTTSDFAQLGTIWDDVPAGSLYMLAGITSNVANWVTVSASGTGTFTSVTVDPGDLTVTAGNVDVTVGNVTIGGDLTVAGTTTLNGTIDIDSAAAIDVNSSYNGAGAVTISTGGGTSSTLVLYNSAGTGDDSIQLISDVGAVELTSSRATAGSINIQTLSTGGGILINAAGALLMEAQGAGADAVAIESITDGITLTAVTGIHLASTGLIDFDTVTDTQASPSATSIIDANSGAATFTGFTTASASSQVFTITNSLVTTSSAILVSVSNEGSNDAQMTVSRVKRGSGTFDVTATNNGAASLNGNVTVSFFVMKA